MDNLARCLTITSSSEFAKAASVGGLTSLTAHPHGRPRKQIELAALTEGAGIRAGCD
jgi:hypothetical protein